jgi:hypothetical protein
MRKAVPLLAAVLLSFSSVARGTEIVLYETDVDINGLTELYVSRFDTHVDLLTGSVSEAAFSATNVAPDFSVADLAYDGSYRLLFETDADVNSLSELYLASYAGLPDLLSGAIVQPTGFVPVNVNPDYSVVGFTYDGSYRVLFETDADINGVTELFLASFLTLDDLLAWNLDDASYSAINVNPDFSVQGLAFDGSYHLLFETDVDINGLTELYISSFSSVSELLTGDFSQAGFSAINVNPDFSVAGYEIVQTPVPEPSTWALLIFGFGVAGIALRSRRAAACGVPT